MNATPEKLAQLVTPEVKSYVNSYLMARAFAECQRERVDAIHAELLAECLILADKGDGRPITKSKELYLSSDDAACAEFYAAADHKLRQVGIKPDDMPDGHCPALVAEHLLINVERLLINASGKPFDVTADKLLGARHGLENWAKWIDLVVTLIVNLPDFKNPLTEKAA